MGMVYTLEIGVLCKEVNPIIPLVFYLGIDVISVFVELVFKKSVTLYALNGVKCCQLVGNKSKAAGDRGVLFRNLGYYGSRGGISVVKDEGNNAVSAVLVDYLCAYRLKGSNRIGLCGNSVVACYCNSCCIAVFSKLLFA